MAFLRRKNQTPDPVLSAIDDLMAFSAQALEVNREEARVSAERLAMLEELRHTFTLALVGQLQTEIFGGFDVGKSIHGNIWMHGRQVKTFLLLPR